MEKYLIILIVFFIGYYVFKCWSSNKIEGFADAQSLVGVDDANSINTLAGIAKKLLEGGLTIPGGGLTVSDNTAEGGRLSIANSSKNGKAGQTNNWTLWNMTGGYGNKLSFWRYNGNGVNAGPAMDLYDDGTAVIPGITKTGAVHLGDKFRLSGVGDGHGNDEWLRLFNTNNTGYSGGFAAGKMYASEYLGPGRNVFVELDDLRNQLNDLKGKAVKFRDVVRHIRKPDGRYVRGDNTSHDDISYSDWIILRENENKHSAGY